MPTTMYASATGTHKKGVTEKFLLKNELDHGGTESAVKTIHEKLKLRSETEQSVVQADVSSAQKFQMTLAHSSSHVRRREK